MIRERERLVVKKGIRLPPVGSRVHCVGVCGAGMAPLAIAMRQAGWSVSGEDQNWNEPVGRWLIAAGVERVDPGVVAEDASLVVVSSAVRSGHPVWRVAADRGLPVIRRGEALAALVAGRELIAVVGSHGKTTTTAMLIAAFRAAGIEADYLLGALFADETTPPAAWRGRGPVIAEIDESDGTIEAFAPEVLLCVNVDWDHCDRYRERDDIEQAFSGIAARTRRLVLVNAGCEASQKTFSAPMAARRMTFGRDGDYRLESARSHEDGRQRLRLGGQFGAVEATVAAAGGFNALNATAALALARMMGAGQIAHLLADFPGVRRRQAEIPAGGEVTVIEDYAHHPTEIAALLDHARERRARRTVAVFQPHRYSRTRQFYREFAEVLARADRVWLLPVYGAGEDPLDGGTSEAILEALRARPDAPPAELLADMASAAERLARASRAGDLLLFIGAGDIDAVARATARWLRETPCLLGEEPVAVLRALDGRLSPESIVRTDEPLGPKTTIRIGGRAELYAEPANTADLQSLIVAARVAGMPVHVLGRGSNLIIPDEGVRGLVVRLQHEHWRRFVCLGPGRYWAGAGLRLKELCGIACRMGEGGFEFLEGIPGTVGGALRMNAGAMGGWIFDLVEQVHYLGLDGSLRIRRREELHVEYRRCAELEDAIALGAILRPAGAEESECIRARILEYQKHRHATQPREPSAGCIFKNPEGDSAGRIIDELGLKGMRVGDAEVSPVHGNFIVNRGQATGADVIELVRRIRAIVRERKAIELEPEVLLYGRDWKEVLG